MLSILAIIALVVVFIVLCGAASYHMSEGCWFGWYFSMKAAGEIAGLIATLFISLINKD